jgi:hypothetical protein
LSNNTILASAPLTATGYHLKATGTTLGQSLIWDNGTNVGIGNTNTSYTLDVSGSGNFSGILTTGSNVGIGVTPSAWYNLAAYVALQVGNASLFGRNSANSELYLSSNVFDNSSGAATYITTDFASRYIQNDGTHTWLTAPSGTAGTAVTFTPRMTILQAGNVGIGTSSPATALDVNGSIRLSGTGYVGFGGGNNYIEGDNPNNILKFGTNNVEKMRITSGGELQVSTANVRAYRSVSATTYPLDQNSFAGYIAMNSANVNGSLSGFSMYADSSYNAATGIFATRTSASTADMVFYAGSNLATEKMRITSVGRLLLNTTSSTQGMLYSVAAANTDGITSQITTASYTAFVSIVPSGSYSAYWVCAGNTAGYIDHPTNTTTRYYTGPSDERLKSNIKNWDENVLDLFKDINPKTYNHNIDNDESIVYKGFIAQEMVDKFPEAYGKDREGFYSFNPSGYIPYLVKAIQELSKQNEELSNRLIKLESK